MQEQERIITLLQSYVEETISPAESEELFSLIDTGAYDAIVEEHILSNLKNADRIAGADLSADRARQIMSVILSAEKKARPHPAKVVGMAWTRWAAAAAVIGIIGLAIFMWKSKVSNDFEAFIPEGIAEMANKSDRALLVKMEDGSSITLQPGSVIHYPAHFSAGKREIYLQGEAFFQVSKNPARPFLVYSSRTVTQVLGTSFTIKENKQKEEVEVAVRTGKVEVYENSKLLHHQKEKSKGVVITPNQKVTYKEEKRLFEPSLVDNPVVVTEDADFVYEGAALSNVLNVLEKAYGIEIVADNKNLYKCIFTGDITQQSLFTKLDIITQAIKASYKIEGTKILIRGKGCK
jgi:ferric-dicitrate binding protein FerR (iron transport regulator)